jgi:hypothetical protein
MYIDYIYIQYSDKSRWLLYDSRLASVNVASFAKVDWDLNKLSYGQFQAQLSTAQSYQLAASSWRCKTRICPDPECAAVMPAGMTVCQMCGHAFIFGPTVHADVVAKSEIINDPAPAITGGMPVKGVGKSGGSNAASGSTDLRASKAGKQGRCAQCPLSFCPFCH